MASCFFDCTENLMNFLFPPPLPSPLSLPHMYSPNSPPLHSQTLPPPPSPLFPHSLRLAGMMCKPGAAGRWNCMDSDLGEGIGKRSGCKRRGQYCEPSLNSGCCPGLRYRSKANFPRVHECC